MVLTFQRVMHQQDVSHEKTTQYSGQDVSRRTFLVDAARTVLDVVVVVVVVEASIGGGVQESRCGGSGRCHYLKNNEEKRGRQGLWLLLGLPMTCLGIEMK